MSAPANPISVRRTRLNWFGAGFVALALGLTALFLWFADVGVSGSDALFRGQPESVWIRNLKYSDEEQVKEWRAYGAAGVQVLIRGLEQADRPGERAYRRTYRRLPGFLARWLPAPKSDSTRVTRMHLVSLLASLSLDAKAATPIMARTLQFDEASSVRQMAISFFTSSEDEKCLLNQLPAKEKAALLPAFIQAVQDPADWGLRNNAAIALRFFPEQRETVVPVLVQTLHDSQPEVRLLAAEALNHLDAAAAKQAGAVSVVVTISQAADDQIASRAIAALREFRNEPEPATRALIAGLVSTNTLVACQSVWSLGGAPEEFGAQRAAIIAALQESAQRSDSVGKYARTALKQWEARPDGTVGAE